MDLYLDHNASTGPRPEALSALASAARLPGNASSLHGCGRRARRLVERARDDVRRLVGAPVGGPEAGQVQVIFTSGGTESDTLAVLGLARARRRECGAREVWLSELEHPAVHAACATLEGEGFVLRSLPVDATGRVTVDALSRDALSGAALCVLMLAHNVTGAVQPVEALAALLAPGVPLHVDAVPAAGKMPIAWDLLGATSLALSAHKLGGPRGVGALVLAPDANVDPVWGGGGQERGLRSGSVPVALVAAFGEACRAAMADLDTLRVLRDRLARALGDAAHVVGAEPRLANTLPVRFAGVSARALVAAAAERGVSLSAGAACHGDRPAPGASDEVVRLSVGWSTTERDVDAAAAVLLQVVRELRSRAA